jgi:hypothetical protein
MELKIEAPSEGTTVLKPPVSVQLELHVEVR